MGVQAAMTHLPPRDPAGRFLPADPELQVMAVIHRTFGPLDEPTRARILRWLSARIVGTEEPLPERRRVA